MAEALVSALAREISGNLTTTGGTNLNVQPTSSQTVASAPTLSTTTRVNHALKRQFPGIFNRPEAKKGKGPINTPGRSAKQTNVTIYVLPGPSNSSPKAAEDLVLAQAGLGKRQVSLSDESKHEEIVRQMEEEFPKLKTLHKRWLFYKAAGGSGQRKLSVIPMDAEGYSGQQLRTVSNNGKITLFLVPLQEVLNTEPLPYDALEFSKMPQVPCVTCNTIMPLHMLALHAGQCKELNEEQQTAIIIDNLEDADDVVLEDLEPTTEDLAKREMCPICQRDFLVSVLPLHASECFERSFDNEVGLEADNERPGTSYQTSQVPLSTKTKDWQEVKDPQKAVQLFIKQLKREREDQESLLLSLDARDSDEERDMSLVSFYKQQRDKSQWTAPFHCRIQGDAAVGKGVKRHVLSSAIAKLKHGFQMNFGNSSATLMFEGQKDHLVPSASAVLVESELFVMAGRLIGHSMINEGPHLSGLSMAVVHAMTGGSKELATSYLCLEDCPDIDHREIIGLLLKEEMTEDETSRLSSLCLEWYFPLPNKDTDKLLLLQQLLTHAVLNRLAVPIKHLKKGLKETGVWPLISSRPDVVPVLFPRESDVELTAKMVLDSIKWPQTRQTIESDDSDDLETETLMVTGFFRQFVQEASSENLRQLMKFWVGWEVPSQELKLEVVESQGPRHLPTSSTCNKRLRLPSHYTTFSALKADMMVCLQSVESGFGLV